MLSWQATDIDSRHTPNERGQGVRAEASGFIREHWFIHKDILMDYKTQVEDTDLRHLGWNPLAGTLSAKNELTG